jgi:hypothetical protein
VVLSALILLFSLFSVRAFAQTTQSGLAPTLPSASAASYYYIAKPGELTMQVNLWGFVKNPGRYEVPSSTDLVQLISFAGGPTDYAKMYEVKITRIVRNDSIQGKREIVLDLERLDKVKDAVLMFLNQSRRFRVLCVRPLSRFLCPAVFGAGWAGWAGLAGGREKGASSRQKLVDGARRGFWILTPDFCSFKNTEFPVLRFWL